MFFIKILGSIRVIFGFWLEYNYNIRYLYVIQIKNSLK